VIRRGSKYEIVGRRLEGLDGSLVDIGARDRRLQAYLPAGLTYLSADMTPGHDLLLNLEESLPVREAAYDVVVALDVLEHLEHIHRAYRELIRITRRRLFISLPNMTCLTLRWQYFSEGHLGAKYELRPEHQGDRHRWLTGYGQLCAFIEAHAGASGCTAKRYDLVDGFGRGQWLISRLPFPPSLRAYTVLFEIDKTAG